jgi:CheY-like chemotaxis protein
MIMVTVEDTGIGISDTNKTLLFQPFHQAQRSAGGTGLGLFALDGRTRALGGTCGLRDRVDGKQGSVFWFTFPYRPDTECECEMTSEGGLAPPSIALPVGVKEASALPPLRILLTDDSASILKVTKRFLERNGHMVVTAENGNQSLERLKASPGGFDLLITDLQMPVMDGFESVRRYREWEGLAFGTGSGNAGGAGAVTTATGPGPGRATTTGGGTTGAAGTTTRRLFILGMSAKADDETRNDVFAVGMDAFVPKPFDYKTLVEELSGFPVFAETLQSLQREVG